ncbi:MAG: TetR/AcrR family transcriptional regulator [Actinomycetaceae bacterium]|nr:TetR/AcrR family transcriptional regulator [Actinomycetaceae bacterium]MDU0970900.1 TetR/AcrR family transcriptional regulator [Actinomycetaceae bacterium]
MRSAKYAFAQALARLLQTRTLDHITVTELVRECGTTRQAFYYHFDSIYGLLEWFYETEAEAMLANHKDRDTWQEGYRNILHWMQNNHQLVVNSYRSVNREYLESFTRKAIEPLFIDVMLGLSKGRQVNEDDLWFITRFYTTALIALTLDWVSRGMTEPADQLAERVEIVMKDTFSQALDKFEAHPHA